MKIGVQHYLKWLDAADPAMAGQMFTVTNLCVLTAQDSKKNILGLTVFEPRSFTEDFVRRLKERQKRPEFQDKSFCLSLPDFLKHRAEGLLGSTNLKTSYTSFIQVKNSARTFHVRDRMRVMSVDDSPVLLKFLGHTMAEFGFVEIVGQISDPMLAVEAIRKAKPDVVTMDIQMPKKTGIQVVREILGREYLPIIMVSSLNMEEGSLVFDALNAGAFDYIQKPKLEDKHAFGEELKSKMLTAVTGQRPAVRQPSKAKRPLTAPNYPNNLIWCFGSSTGGTQALTQIFTSMPETVPPTLIVQHIPPIFSKAFADLLNSLVPFTVKEAVHGEPVLQNHVYIAPGGHQMGVEQKFGKLHIVVNDAPHVNRFKPSVDYLFHEVAKVKNLKLIGAILTGMGRDGAEGLKSLKKAGAVTFAQDEASCTVYGMPRAAVELGAVDRTVTLDEFSQALLEESARSQKAS